MTDKLTEEQLAIAMECGQAMAHAIDLTLVVAIAMGADLGLVRDELKANFNTLVDSKIQELRPANDG